MLFSCLIIGINILLLIIYLLLRQKINNKTLLTTLKISSVILFSLGFFKSFLNDYFVWIINGGTYDSIYFKSHDYLHSFLRWFLFCNLTVLPCAVFFKNRQIRNIAVYFCLPTALLCTFFYNDFLFYYLKDANRGIMTSAWVRHLEFSLELGLMIFIPLFIRFGLKHKFDIHNKTEWFYFFLLIPLIMLVTIPVYVPQSLFGFTKLFMVPFSFQHALWIILILVILAALYFSLRFKSYETRFLVCIFLALYLFLNYNTIYLMDLKLSRLPFQLCNLGSYLVLIGLLIKKKTFFDFIILANVPGAMIAFLVPDIDEGMMSLWNMHFYIEHTWIFILPLLAVCLRIKERPLKGAIKHYFVGFSIYFIFCFVIGLFCNAYLWKPNSFFFNKVNYFYIFSDHVLDFLPILSFTKLWAPNLNGFVFYPNYILMVYILFSIFVLAYYYIYLQLMKTGDYYFHLRQIRIDLYQERGKYLNRKVPQKEYLD